ncbi:MAG: DUF3365 domain-containing protein [Cyanobacteria bacterium J06635_15]
MAKQLKLGVKFTLILGLAFVCGILISGALLSQASRYKAEEMVENQTLLMIETMNSVRNYTSNSINPQLQPLQASRDDFIRETIPAYSATEVFEDLRSRDDYFQQFFYKEATLNPTNLRDQADEFETALIEQFRQKPDLKEISNFRDRNGERFFFVSRPLSINNVSCLECHGDPQDAPPSLINTYGSQHGFNWQMGEIVTAQTIYVPSETVFASYHRHWLHWMGLFSGIFVLVLLLINGLINRVVIRPLQPITQLAQQMSQGNITPEEAESIANQQLKAVAKGGDELSILAQMFQKMVRAVVLREQAFSEQIQSLRDLVARAKQVRTQDSDTTAESLQSLRDKARDLTQKRRQA